MSATRRFRARWRAPAVGLSLALVVCVLPFSGSAASGVMPHGSRVAPWVVSVRRLVGHLPISVSVAEDGRLVYAHAGNTLRPPASDEKLLLSMALLDRFGAHYRIPTRVEGPRPKDGLVRGNLWLVGHGDPELKDAALERLARALRATGIRTVRGSVIGVTNMFTRERWAPGWQPIALRFIALPTALTFEANSGLAGFVFDPERRAAATLTDDLRTLGARVRGRPKAGPGPTGPEPVLSTIRSARTNADIAAAARAALAAG